MPLQSTGVTVVGLTVESVRKRKTEDINNSKFLAAIWS
jgi:hypothetical protein